ncbi:hypothetical protein [Paenibacillus sacheonensis]|uniref:Uncharacterized protein n=1 Tax=Paenibacillus sacheonensis TaxID=742054 RepID=A0A7X5BXB0_9BACL|nr:hypothetical protein [Paenibacillus sacheonensis]MBM7568779.1 hypothetical protein [Paenibacillus sacheonensis]NBC68387.1 hypothetical protein [Paenibacillus sacheonensis]
MPQYKQGSYGGESVSIANDHVRVDVHKRLTGWGWAEIFTADGRFMGVLEHFGELLLRDQEIPIRMESSTWERDVSDSGESLVFQVKALNVQQMLRGTSFDSWIQYPFDAALMEGEVKLTLLKDDPVLQLDFKLTSRYNLFARYVRGPWVKVGADSFGARKTDAIFPGIEWLEGEEWSSGTDWFKDPWALRAAPHPNKAAMPLMAVSCDGLAVGLSWNAGLKSTRWFNYRTHLQQPVFASPNFIDRRNNHLLGLMVPDAAGEHTENQIYAAEPLELHPQQTVAWSAELFVVPGSSLDAVTFWIRRNGGLPAPSAPRWPYEEALHRIADAYGNRYWTDGQGFGTPQHDKGYSLKQPRFAEAYLERYSGSESAAALRQAVEKCQTLAESAVSASAADPLERGLALLAHQRDDGSFPFDPDGRHYMKDDFVVARAFLEPMGLAGDTALDLCVLPAIELFLGWQATGDERLKQGALRAVDYCLPLTRPEGGDFWETPLHSPNLFAAGHAAIAYELAYQAAGEQIYRDKAIYWLRALLPFTHLWEPNDKPMLYNTKPCFCSSDWYFANWVRDHVQWEVLETFAESFRLGIDWAGIDPAIDWNVYHEGITNAALRWMLDHRDETWMPHNLQHTKGYYEQGLLDDCFADTHNAVTGLYGGMAIMPDVIAVNLLALLGHQP